MNKKPNNTPDCTGCIRDKKISINDTCIGGVWTSPHKQILYAAKCPQGSCKHDT